MILERNFNLLIYGEFIMSEIMPFDPVLTHKFTHNGKSVQIGKFDPSHPARTFLTVGFEHLGQEIFDQIENANVFTKEELEYLTICSPKDFLECITEL
jgi:hypothetical protein